MGRSRKTQRPLSGVSPAGLGTPSLNEWVAHSTTPRRKSRAATFSKSLPCRILRNRIAGFHILRLRGPESNALVVSSCCVVKPSFMPRRDQGHQSPSRHLCEPWSSLTLGGRTSSLLSTATLDSDTTNFISILGNHSEPEFIIKFCSTTNYSQPLTPVIALGPAIERMIVESRI